MVFLILSVLKLLVHRKIGCVDDELTDLFIVFHGLLLQLLAHLLQPVNFFGISCDAILISAVITSTG